MGQLFGWWQLSSLHHRIATDVRVGKVRLAIKVSLEGKAKYAQWWSGGLSYGKKKVSIYIWLLSPDVLEEKSEYLWLVWQK